MNSLNQSQHEWSTALLQSYQDVVYPSDITAPHKPSIKSRFAIYRNNVWSSLINGLADSYEVVKTLVGEDFFNGLAQRYITKHPPQSPIMSKWGGHFSELIANDIDCKSVPYLADVAQLEWLRICLYHALDETPLSTTEVQTILTTNINQLMDCSIQMLTASDILNSQFNTASIWSLHQQYDAVTQSVELENALLELDIFQPQSMLIWRNQLTIEVIPIELSTGLFLSELKKGQTIGQAIEHCVETYPELVIPQLFAVVLQLPCIASIQLHS